MRPLLEPGLEQKTWATLLGAVFLLTGVAKLASLADFHESLLQFVILPGPLRGLVLIFLPGFEVTIAFALLSGFERCTTANLTLTLMGVFLFVAAYKYGTGNFAACHCMPLDQLQKLNEPFPALLRNVVLSIIAARLVVLSRRLDVRAPAGGPV